MPSSELARAAEAAREFSVTAGITLRLRIPTRLQMQRMVAKSGGDIAATQEDLLLTSIIGWSGINAAAIAPDADGDLSFDGALIPYVIDAYPAAADAAFLQLLERYAQRREKVEAAAGN